MSSPNVRFEERAFADFDTATLYEVLAARARVFIVEQRCQYLDPDGKDLVSRHLLARVEGRLVGYLRIVPAGLSFPEPAIGRVLTLPELRGRGLGRALMLEALASIARTEGPVAVSLSAQAQLVDWYGAMGFVAAGDVYEDAGIPHVDMTRPGG